MPTASQKPRLEDRPRRRGVVIVQVIVLLVVLMGCAALTIDVGNLYRARGELQRAADSSSLAGASAFVSKAMLEAIQGGSQGVPDLTEVADVLDGADSRAIEFSEKNNTLQSPTQVDEGDIVLGRFNFDDPDEPLDTGVAANQYNAVQVTLRRTNSSANGAVPYTFAQVFGLSSGETKATATAAFDDRFRAYREDDNGNYLVPFTIHKDQYESQLYTGADEWSYNESDDDVSGSADDIKEVKLFPYKLSGGGDDDEDDGGSGKGKGKGGGGGGDEDNDGSGNFGLLNVGTGNQGLAAIENQILNGISSADLISEVGTDELEFFDDDGNAVTYDITGDPGMKAGCEDSVEVRVGDVIGFFLHDQVTDNGANSTYRIVGLRFGRVMHIDLSGSPDDKQLIIQPVIFSGPNIVTDEGADSSDGMVGHLSLVR